MHWRMGSSRVGSAMVERAWATTDGRDVDISWVGRKACISTVSCGIEWVFESRNGVELWLLRWCCGVEDYFF